LSREKFDTNTLQTQNTRWGREMGITWKWNEEDHWRWVTSSHFTHPFYFYSYSKRFKRHARMRVCSESPPLALWFFHFIVVTHPFLKTQFLDTPSLLFPAMDINKKQRLLLYHWAFVYLYFWILFFFCSIREWYL
jgi:hypothetical protein